jgi:hypothetical protein
MRAELTTTWHRAARPIDGPVLVDADAVFFADEAEMLACAARDICTGPLSWFWWWRHLLHESSFEHLVAAWRDAPAYIPAAFESLRRTGAAEQWIRRLAPASAGALLDVMLRAYTLPALADGIGAVWREPEPQDASRQSPPAERRDIDVVSIRAGARRPSIHVSPWNGVVPAEWDAPGLPLVSRTFAAMCIVLRRVPWLPRSERFLRLAVTYLREARRIEPRDRWAIERAGRSTGAGTPPHAEPAEPIAAAGRASSESHTRAPETSGGTLTPRASRAAHATGPSAAARPLRTFGHKTSDGRPPRSGNAAVNRERVPPTAQTLPRSGDASPPSQVAQSPPDESPHQSLDAVESAYAGAFFLINVAIDLGLYSHGITMVDELELSVWRFVETVARELLIDYDPDDTLWGLLLSFARPAAEATETNPEPDLSQEEHEQLIARVRSRLAELLDGLEDPAGVLICRRGRVVRSPGHLDVRFPLNSHPIEIRAARLDRNPGWVPAAGVHVGFHFD